jgi:lipopolysaccharide export LptBFGC system permease protein LptF
MEKNNMKQKSKAPVFIITALIYIALSITLFQAIKKEQIRCQAGMSVPFLFLLCIGVFFGFVGFGHRHKNAM